MPAHISERQPVVNFDVFGLGTTPTGNYNMAPVISSKTGIFTVQPADLYIWNDVGTGIEGITGTYNGGGGTIGNGSQFFYWNGVTTVAPGGTLGGIVYTGPGSPDAMVEITILGIWTKA
jgi:hypothetical protein